MPQEPPLTLLSYSYGGCTALGVIFAMFFMHEVRGKSLESIDTTFEGSALATSWPKVFQTARLTEARLRKNSRSQSTNLPGETRAEIREHVQMETIGENSVFEEEE
jgi:hypothetical protein